MFADVAVDCALEYEIAGDGFQYSSLSIWRVGGISATGLPLGSPRQSSSRTTTE